MLKQRVITASILAILFLAALFQLPASGWTVLVGLVVLQGAWEWSKLAKMRGMVTAVYMGTMLLSFVAVIWVYNNLQPQQISVMQLCIYGLSAVFWIMIVPAWFKFGWRPQNLWLLGATGWIVLLPTGMAMLDLRAEIQQPWWLLGVMAMVWMADISAYFAGRKFGKNKLAPAISPGKTWEGVAGAMLGVSVYVVLVWSFSAYFSQRELLPVLLLASWWWVALAVIGDLFESAIKRQAGVKDSGALLPGHGGLLDRIDALTSTLPLAALAILLQRLS